MPESKDKQEEKPTLYEVFLADTKKDGFGRGFMWGSVLTIIILVLIFSF